MFLKINNMLISIIANTLLVIAIIIMIIKWPKTITIKDKHPKVGSPKNYWMQLQNEGAPYLKITDEEVSLKIVK